MMRWEANMSTTDPVTIETIRAAAAQIEPRVHRTPVQRSSTLDRLTGAQLFFKCENFQRVGAFKIRGATNAVFSLSEAEARAGVVTHSSGNHAQAVALAAAQRSLTAHVVMPRTAPAVKRAATAGYGATIHTCEPTLDSREQTAAEVVVRTGAAFIHPYNDVRVVSGQGTAALELIEQAGDLDVVIAPVGGGGLLSGTAVAVTELVDHAEVWGAEPAGADDAKRSLEQGRLVPSEEPRTICDALLTSLGELTFALISRRVAQIGLVDDEATLAAMRLIWERMKLVVEPSAAVPLALALDQRDQLEGKRVGIILSGGNVELSQLPW